MCRRTRRKVTNEDEDEAVNRTAQLELGERVVRALAMENTGSPARRVWWIVSSVLAECNLAA